MSDYQDDFYRGGARGPVRPGARPGPLWTAAFLTFVALNFFVFMGFDTLLPTLSLYLEKHGNTEAEIGRIFGTFTISAILMRMLAARLAGRLEAVWLVRLGLLGCMAAGIYYYWAYTVPTGMAARFLHGAGFGLASTLITALASQIIPPARMGEGMGYLGLGSTVALAVGPFFGLWLLEEFGYLIMFAVVAGFYLAAVLAVSFLPKIRLASAEPGAPKPKLAFLSRRVLSPSILMFLMGLIMSAVTIFLALFCKEKNLPYAGHFFVFSTIGIFISRFSAGRIYDRLGHAYVLLPASLLLLGSLIVLHQAESRETMFLVAVVYGLSTGALFPALQALALSAVPLTGRTEATASFFNSFDLGIGCGAILLGQMASQAGSYGEVYAGAAWVAGAFILYYVACYLVVKPMAAARRAKRGAKR